LISILLGNFAFFLRMVLRGVDDPERLIHHVPVRGHVCVERRGEIEATVKRMEADAAAAEEKLQKLNRAGMQSWSALMGALAETRAAFDRANQAAQEAFKRAA
jgi:hypothetical protein